MKTETWSPEETFQLGKRLGEQAQPGQIYTLSGRSGCRKNCIYKRSSSRTGHPGTGQQSHLYHSAGVLRRAAARYIILMYTGLKIRRKWRK